MDPIIEKCCSECGQVKPLEQYHQKTASKDGKNSHCKTCHNARMVEYRRTNPDKVSASRKKSLDRYRAINANREIDETIEKPCCRCGQVKPLEQYHGDPTKKDGKSSSCKDCRNSCPKRQAAMRKYRESHADELNAYSKAWRQANPDRFREYHKQYIERNREKWNDYQREYQAQYRLRKKAEKQAKGEQSEGK